MATTIKYSVGEGGRNVTADVEAVQKLLNRVPVQFGGPSPKVTTFGTCGTLTVETIYRFQRTSVPGITPDGRVDPYGQTLKRLNDLAAAASYKVLLTGPAGYNQGAGTWHADLMGTSGLKIQA